MASFFNGWIGYGTGLAPGVLHEPTDSAYARRPVQYSDLEGGLAFDLNGGTVGPSSMSWGVLAFAGLFDAQSSGNLLLSFPLFLPVAIGTGTTYTTGPGSNIIVCSVLRDPGLVQSFPAGTVIGTTPDGRPITSNLPLQVCGGILSAQSPTFGTTVTMATLPADQPASGSGLLWNNGGIVAVA